MSTPETARNDGVAALTGLVDALDLPDISKKFLQSRWLNQVAWMEARATQARNRFYFLRLTTIIGGVMVPALVGLKLAGRSEGAIDAVTFLLSVVVAVCAAVEGFLRYGERWRHYRQTSEWLKSEGWRYLQLTERYSRLRTHLDAYPTFARRIESAIAKDVDSYIAEIAVERETDEAESRRS